MISEFTAKLIDRLPKPVIKLIGGKILNSYIKKYANIEVTGMENLEKLKKPSIFVCNHLSNSDALILNKILKNQDITFVAGVKLSSNPITNIGIMMTKTTPVKPDSPDKDGIKKIVNLLKEGNNILLFPEGTRSRTGEMIQGKKGVILMAKLAKAEIVPIGIWGTEKLLPINNGNMSHENFNYADVKISIGIPYSLPEKEEGEDRKDHEERTMNYIMKNIANLLPQKYRGFYN